MPTGKRSDDESSDGTARRRSSGSSREQGGSLQDGSGQGSWPLSLVAALVGGLVAASCVALAESALFGGTWLVQFGLLAIPALGASLAAGWAAGLVFDPRLPPLGTLLASRVSRLRLLALGPLTVAALVFLAGITRGLLVAFSDRPNSGGVLIALVAVGGLTFAAYVGDALAFSLESRLARVPSAVAIGVFLASLGASLALLIALGETSGGKTTLSMFGVLRREELNLKPLLGLSVIAVGAGVLSSMARVRGKMSLGLLGFLLCALLLIGGYAGFQAVGLGPRESIRIQRGDGLGASILGKLLRLSDRDRDGAAAWFGGGDCDDRDPLRAPGHVDVPGNGVDEDCVGGDAEVSLPPPAPEKPAVTPSAALDDANVLLLTVDTLRYDLGYMREEERPRLSPRLDAYAKRSIVYERAYSLASYTSKSLGPMLIGRYPSETVRSFEHFDRFHPSVPFIQQRLQDAGVRTISAQAYWYFFMKSYGLERGWDELDHTSAPAAINIEGDSHVSGDKLATVVENLLSDLSKSDQRFFFWAHWVDPHSEYVRHADFDFGNEPRARYDSEVAFVDAAIGRVLDAVERHGLSDETVVIITSDHGEAFGEHGMIRHGFEVWEELVRVPLILHVPGATPRRVAKPRSLIDVAKTIADVFDLELAGDDDFLRGSSLLEDAFLEPGDEPESRPVLVDMPQGPHNQERRAYIEEGQKLITSAGRTIGLYDLEKDPGEKNDLSEQEQLALGMERKMKEFLSRLRPVPAQR